MAQTGDVIDGKYEILKEIGRGGMSTVYLAIDIRMGKMWAVKEIRKGTGKKEQAKVLSLYSEADLMKDFDHPAFPRVVDIIERPRCAYVVMDYIEGRPLNEVIEKEGPVCEEQVILWALQICRALKYLHCHDPQVIYRDLKPANLMLSPEGNIKIIDFGAAKAAKEQSAAGPSYGTKGYAAQEQYEGRADERSDIYALGRTMQSLLSGRPPLNDDLLSPEPYEKVSEGLRLITDKCTEKDPDKRYQNCAELEKDLENPELLTGRYQKKQRRRIRLFILAAAMSAVFLTAGLCLGAASEKIYAADYERLIKQVDSLESYVQAVNICPSDIRAYIKILESYEEDGFFGPEESALILALYNKNMDLFDTSSAEYARLNYKLGTMYFNYYTSDDEGSYTISERVQKAWPFFLENHDNEDLCEDFEDASLCEGYYRICLFYRQFIFASSSVDEADKEDYEQLIASAKEAVSDISDEEEYERLSLYNAVFLLLYDRRKAMALTGVNEEEVLSLFDEIYERAEGMYVYRQQNVTLKEEICDNYEAYRRAIEITYENTEKLNAQEG